jgi:hypothetical protein
MPQAAVEAIAEWLATYVFTSASGYAISYAVATVIVSEIAQFALGKISQALAAGQSDDIGPPPPFEIVHTQARSDAAPFSFFPVNVDRLAFSTGSLGGFQSRAANGWRVVGFADHEQGADYFDE